jgi:hypothetical protein
MEEGPMDMHMSELEENKRFVSTKRLSGSQLFSMRLDLLYP